MSSKRKGIKERLVARIETRTWTGEDLLPGWQEAALAPPSPRRVSHADVTELDGGLFGQSDKGTRGCSLSPCAFIFLSFSSLPLSSGAFSQPPPPFACPPLSLVRPRSGCRRRELAGFLALMTSEPVLRRCSCAGLLKLLHFKGVCTEDPSRGELGTNKRPHHFVNGSLTQFCPHRRSDEALPSQETRFLWIPMWDTVEGASTFLSPWVFYYLLCLPLRSRRPSFPPDSRLQKAAAGVWKALLSGHISPSAQWCSTK